MLELLGWFIVGALLVSCLVRFWDDIKAWLNNTAADAVERLLGYSAREKMEKAFSRVTRIGDRLFNRTIIHSKSVSTAAYYDKTTIEAYDNVSNIDPDVLEELRKADNELIQTFEYKG